MRHARTLGLVALALCCTCTGVLVARVEPHASHAAALVAGAVVAQLAQLKLDGRWRKRGQSNFPGTTA